ncbi:MAG: DUF5320 domain-containing protein [Phycisphaerales bacterium]|nr:DUF5320 domain-containing protein [Phycisphaerales bacterium]
MLPGSRAESKAVRSVEREWSENNNTQHGGSDMPGGDRTGPEGLGPMTGRAAGLCAGNDAPGYTNPVRGMGMGRGRNAGGGGGRGRRGGRGWRGGSSAVPLATSEAPAMTNEQQIDDLRKQAEQIEITLSALRDRIETLQGAVEQ